MPEKQVINDTIGKKSMVKRTALPVSNEIAIILFIV